MTTVESKIKEIYQTYFEQIGVNYMFMDWARANVAMDGITKPTIIYVQPVAGTLDVNLKRSRIYDHPEAAIAFVVPCDFDYECPEVDSLIEEMKRLAIAFVAAVNLTDYFEPIEGELEYSTPIDILDENVAGVIITLPLKEKQGVGFCEEHLKTDIFEEIFGYKLTSY